MYPFNNKRGLCGNLAAMFNRDTDIAVYNEMLKQFVDAGLPDNYPFGRTEYFERRGTLTGDNDGTMHQCPSRLQWAFDHAMYPPAGQSAQLTQFYKHWYSWASWVDGVPTGYAIYKPDGNGKFVGVPCTKAQYEAQIVINTKAQLGEITKHPL